MGEEMEPAPRFRGEVVCALAGGAAVTTVVEVPRDRYVVVLRLVDDDLFTVALAEPHVAHMAIAARAGEISYVSAEHAHYGHVLLGVRPHVASLNDMPDPRLPVPLALYLELPAGQAREVLLDAAQSAELVRHLDEGLRLIGPPSLDE